MNLIAQVQEMLPECSKTERKIADHLLKWPYDFSRHSCDAISQKIGVSRSAIIRFCHKCGYDGYNSFRYALMADQKEMQSAVSNNSEAASALACYEDCLHKIEEVFTPAETAYFTDKLIHANRVFSVGFLHGALFAEQMAFRLNRSGIDCHALDDPSIVDCYTSMLKPGDVIIILAVTITRNSSLSNSMAEFRKRRVTVILLTMDPVVSSRELFDHIVILPSAIYSNSRFMLDEAVPFFLAIECIVEGVHIELAKTIGPDALPEINTFSEF